jgi:hypothetical protein
MDPKKVDRNRRVETSAPAARAVDMSPEAIDRRLRELGQLYELGLEIRGARWLGTVEEIARGQASPKSDLGAKPQDARGT